MRSLLLLIVWLLWPAAGSTSTPIDGSPHFSTGLAAGLNHITGLIYNDRFDEAGRIIDSLERAGSQPGFGHLFRAIWYQSQMMAAESDSLQDRFMDVLDSLDDDARDVLKVGGDSALAYFFLGHGHAFRSIYYGRSGRLIKALKSGLAARKAYDAGYEIDPAFYDLALGLGSYRYWKSVKTKAINWTPLFKNEKREGIELLRLAADSSLISRDAATVALIWVYLNEKRYAAAIRLADRMHRRYPEGLTFLWALGRIYYEMDDCRAAVDIYEDILERLRADPGNYFNIIEAAGCLSDCYRQLADRRPEMAGKLSRLRDEIDAMPIPAETQKRQKKKLRKILEKTD